MMSRAKIRLAFHFVERNDNDLNNDNDNNSIILVRKRSAGSATTRWACVYTGRYVGNMG